MLKYFKHLSEKKLLELAKLTGGAAFLVMAALVISGGVSANFASNSYDTDSQTAGLYWAVKNNGNFRSFNNSNAAVGPKGNLDAGNWTGSSGVGVGDNGNPAPRGCSYKNAGSAKTCAINYGNSDNFNIFGVFAAYETNNPSNGGASYFRGTSPGGGDDFDGWKLFWEKPSIGFQRKAGNDDPVDLEGLFNIAFTIKDDATQNNVASKIGGSGLFSSDRFTMTKAELQGIAASDRNQEAMDKPFVQLGIQSGAIGRGDASSRPIIVPAGQKVTVEWACQPYQVNYFNTFCSRSVSGDPKCESARIIDLFDRVSREDSLSAYGNNDINRSVEFIPTGDGVYSLRCVANARSGSKVETPGTISFSTAGRNGPKMQLYINTAATPVSRIQANSVAYNTNTTVNDATNVVIHANFTTDTVDDQILETRIMEGATVRATGTTADINYSYTSAGGVTRTFTPQIRTSKFPSWANYGGAVTVSVNAAVTRTLTVNSTGATGAVITSSPAGNNGTTNYVKTGIANGAAITLTAPALAGTANFSAWTGCDSTNVTARTCTVTMNANKTVSAAYTAAVTRTLTVNSTGTAGVAVTGSVATYSGTTNYVRSAIPNGTSITLTAPATSGTFNFSAWTGCDSTNATARTCTVAMSADKTVSVAYTAAITRTLTVNSTGATGAVIASSPTGNNGTTNYVKTGITDGTAITLTAPATVGTSNFMAWTGCDTTNATARTCTVTMNANKTVSVAYDICPIDIPGTQSSIPTNCVNPATNGGRCVPTGYTWNTTTNQCVPTSVPQCSDGINNDGDAFIDMADPGCSSSSDNDESNVIVLPPSPSIVNFSASPSRVRAGTPTTLRYTVNNPPAGGCSITGTNGFSVTVNPPNGTEGTRASNNIGQTTIFTLTCGSAPSGQATVTVIPEYEEI